MIEVSVTDFEKDFDTYMDRIEAGGKFLIRQPDGRGVMKRANEQTVPRDTGDRG